MSDDPYWACLDCLRRRSACICTPKAEFNLSDDIAKRVVERYIETVQQWCREVASMGAGYRLAVRRERSRPSGPADPVVYTVETCILLPGGCPPPGEWVIYSPWETKEVDDQRQS